MNRRQFFQGISNIIPFDPNTDLTYTGSYSIIDDGDGNWRVKFTTNGTLVFLKDVSIDIFLVGGGGGGSDWYGAGGGGYTETVFSLSPVVDAEYPVVIGTGGAKITDGTASSALSQSAAGGKRGWYHDGGDGGSGGGRNGTSVSGTDGASATGGSDGDNGIGQGTTTREFEDASGDRYAAGGKPWYGTAGTIDVADANSGMGGDGQDGANHGNAVGSNGIVIIRNHRAA